MLNRLGLLWLRVLEANPDNGGGVTDPPKDDKPPADPPKDDKAPADPPKDDKSPADPPKDDKVPAPRAPEKYGAFELPEGITMQPDEVQEFEGFARGLDLTQEQAQKLLAREHTYLGVVREDFLNQSKALQEGWRNEVRADKEVGGEQFNENSALVKKAVTTFFPGVDANTAFLDNPPVFKGLLKLAKQYLKEDGFVPGGANPKAKRSSMYPNSNHAEG